MKGSLGPTRRDLCTHPAPWVREKVCPSQMYLLFLPQGLTGAKGEPGPTGIPGVKVSGLLEVQHGQSRYQSLGGAVAERSRNVGDPSL